MAKVVDIYPHEVIEREENEQETKARLDLLKTYETRIADEAAKADAKTELLARLGLTAEEANLLLS
jgi:hypothetical protein